MKPEDNTNENISENLPKSYNYGWVCPKCGRVYSPFTSMCTYCAN